MTANLQSYSIPFDARVPPVYPASIINDEFRAQSPTVPDTLGTPHPYVSLDPKWVRFAPGGGMIASFIDPQRQMLILSGTPEKKWTGVMQNLPQPAVGEENEIGYTLVTRMLNAQVQVSLNDNYGPIQFGMLLGQDLVGDPEGSPLWAICSELTRTGSTLTGRSLAATAIAYDAPLSEDGLSELQPFQFLAAQVLSVQPTLGVWETEIGLSVSADGVFFQRLRYYPDLDVPIQQVVLAQRAATTTSILTAADFIRLYPLVAGDDDLSLTVGQTLQQGSV
jgi:hypothetical protein